LSHRPSWSLLIPDSSRPAQGSSEIVRTQLSRLATCLDTTLKTIDPSILAGAEAAKKEVFSRAVAAKKEVFSRAVAAADEEHKAAVARKASLARRRSLWRRCPPKKSARRPPPELNKPALLLKQSRRDSPKKRESESRTVLTRRSKPFGLKRPRKWPSHFKGEVEYCN
jgi:translation initiation factor 3 subunit A